MKNRVQQIKAKGFEMYPVDSDTPDTLMNQPIDFTKIRVGGKSLEDAVLDRLYGFKKIDARLGDKNTVLKAINNGDYATLRDVSNFFYRTSGIYSRLCRYMAYLYKYDWFITPYIDGCQGLLDTDSGIADDS